jgi:hypothetical protein
MPPPQSPQGLAHPAASMTPASVAEVAKRNRFMCGPLVGIIPERERKTGVAPTHGSPLSIDDLPAGETIMRQKEQWGKW